MRGSRALLISAALVLLTPSFQSEEFDINVVDLEEMGDSPNYLWGSSGAGHEWYKISDSNGTYLGNFGLNDSIDIIAINVSSEKWTVIGFSIKPEGNVTISIQRLDQTTWTIVEFANESNGEIELDGGIHAIRIERLGGYGEELEYRFTITNQGLVDVEGQFVNLAWKFTPFYIFAGVFLISPLILVLWWNRHNVIGDSKKRDIINEHEKSTLMKLKMKFQDESNSSEDQDKIRSSLNILSEESWESVIMEFGDPEVRHLTDGLEVCAWRFTGVSRSILVGIKNQTKEWKMAAIRFFSPLGEDIPIENVEPKMMFQGDEVYIGDLRENTTVFLRVMTLGVASKINMHISGMIGGNPVAATLRKSLSYESE